MTQTLRVSMAKPSDAQLIGTLVYELLLELIPNVTDTIPVESATTTAKNLLTKEKNFWAFLLYDAHDNAIGILTLNQCVAIYAGGKFGEISELYVRPERRSSGAGNLLINAAVQFAKEQSWPRLEVGAPALPMWQRTVNFYKNNGFKEIGPRLKLTV